MASIKPYKTARGRAWRVQYRSPDGKIGQNKDSARKNEAQTWADKNSTTIREGDWINPNAGEVAVSELHPAWWATLKPRKPNYRRQLNSAWEHHVKPHWGHRKANSIKPSEVQSWIGSIEKHRPGREENTTPSATLILNCHAVLMQILEVAVNDGLIRKPRQGHNVAEETRTSEGVPYARAASRPSA